jgi:hypothetical protein
VLIFILVQLLCFYVLLDIFSKGNRIECENDVKLLGVTIDYELKFDISDICKKKSLSPTKCTKAH